MRTIKHEFFLHEGLAELGHFDRLLFIGLWTVADRDGRMDDRPKRIKAALFPYDEVDIDSAIGRLADAGFIVRYESDGERYIAIPSFSKHQKPHRKESPSEIPPPSSREKDSTSREKDIASTVPFAESPGKDSTSREKDSTSPVDNGEWRMENGSSAAADAPLASEEKAKSKEMADPRHSQVTRLFFDAYEKAKGNKYIFQPKDGSGLKRLLRATDVSVAEFGRRIEAAFGDSFFRDKSASLAYFCSNFNAYASTRPTRLQLFDPSEELYPDEPRDTDA
jgi:hypothetical protein